MNASETILVCFAVEQEARAFRRAIGRRPEVRILLTGIGPTNAGRVVEKVLSGHLPSVLMSCGFAGGLNPDLQRGAVMFSVDDTFGPASALLAAGARAARFYSASRVIPTAREKRALRAASAADAVEMESGVISELCRERGVRWVTVRVISDRADEDLPLDFNRFMTAGHHFNYLKLMLALIGSPGKIGELRRFQRSTQAAAERLAVVLAELVISGALLR